MDKKYFSVNEVVKHFKKKGYDIDFEDICGYVRKHIIHPVVYIDSIAAHAHETTNEKQALAIGFCYLSAYWHISEDKLTALCDNLLRKQIVTTRGLNIEELTQIRITSWMTKLHHFEGVPDGHICPKPFSNDLAITGFIFPPTSPFSINIGNIAISEDDLEILNNYNASILPKNNPQNTADDNALKKLIKKTMNGSGISKPEHLWKHLQQLIDDLEITLITDIEDWDLPKARLFYKLSDGKEASIGKKRFQNIISELQ